MTSKSKQFSHWLHRKLAETGMNARTLASKAGITESGMSLLMSGQRNPSISTLRKISVIFGMDIAVLMVHAGYADHDDIHKPDTQVKVCGIIQPDHTIEGSVNHLPVDMSDSNNIEALLLSQDGIFPMCKKGDVILFSRDAKPKPGDLVYTQLKGSKPSIKRYFATDERKRMPPEYREWLDNLHANTHDIPSISLFVPAHSSQQSMPLIARPENIEFMYRVTSLKFL